MDRYGKAWTATNMLIRQGRSFSGHERHCCFLNTGRLPFADVSAAVGLDLTEDGRALPTVDWAHDGDLDLWMTNRTGPRIRFFCNDYPRQHHFLSVRLEGRTCNRDAIGARLELYLAGTDQPKRIKTLRAGDGFLGQSSKSVHFGLGPHAQIDRLVVRWPGGQAEEFRELAVDRHYLVVQGSGQAKVWTSNRQPVSLVAGNTEIPATTEQARIVLAARLPLPAAQYENSQGGLVPLVDRPPRGPILVNLWASWCQPCLAELKEFVQHHERLRDEHLTIIALCVDRLEVPQVPRKSEDTLLSLGYSFASGWATPALVRALDAVDRTVLDHKGPLPLPSSFLIDPHGNLAVIYKGRMSVDQILADLKLLDLDPRELRDFAIPFPGRWATPPKSTDPLQIAVALYESGLVDLAETYTRQMETLLTEGAAATSIDEPTQIQKRADAHAYRGAMLLEQKRLEEAISAFGLALELLPRDVRLHMKLAEAYTKLGQKDQAARRLSSAVAISPDDPDVHYHLAIALSDLGRQHEAIEHDREALRLRPGWPPAANNLAWILATHPDSDVRDGALAVKLAQETCRLVHYLDPTGLDTLAAGQAETRDFPAAANTARRAAELARQQGKHALAARIEQRLELFERGQPFRDQSLAVTGGR